jgi:hypothetical protein
MRAASALRPCLAGFIALSSVVLCDTFAQTSLTWAQQTPVLSPSPRSGAAMTYDGASQKILLFGGFDGANLFGDTWTYDGSTWVQITPPVSPPARMDATMAYDAPTNRVILYGGSGSAPQLGDTWIWNGANSTWTQSVTTGSPAPATLAMSFTDPLNGHVDLFGGAHFGGYLSQMWQWSGSNWLQLNPTTLPFPRASGITALDPSQSKVVLFGGKGALNPTNTWLWDGVDWQMQSPANQPPLRYLSGAAYEPILGHPVMFGGWDGAIDLNDTWEWTGTDWLQLAPLALPPGREAFGLALHPGIGHIVLFGGADATQWLDETWRLDAASLCCQPFCPGDGTGTACPCGNSSPVGSESGCLNSLGSGGKLVSSGVASLAGDTVVLVGTGMPSSSALYFQGTTQINGSAGLPFGDGLRCVGGTIIRLSTKTNAGGASQFPSAGDPPLSVKGQVAAPGARMYQVWYRNAAPFCTGSTFNLTNGFTVNWGP